MNGPFLLAGLLTSLLLPPVLRARPIRTDGGDATQRSCPTVTVTSPDSVNEGTSFFFTANVSGGNPSVTPTFNWVVSAGTISSGQGTTTIALDTKGLGGQSVTATVDVGGFGRACNASSSATAYVVKRPTARKIDEYGALNKDESSRRLDNFAIELMNDPACQGYIIGYGGRRSRVGTGLKTADAAKTYLVEVRGLGASLVTVDGGYREEVTTELWVVPSGATPPTASPTVDPSEIKPSKPARKTTVRRTKNSD